MSIARLITLTALFAAVGVGCATPKSTYRSSTLQITGVTNTFTEELASIKSPRIDEAVNRAMIDDGRFKQGTGLRLTLEITRFDPPRRSGTQTFADRLGADYRFLPGLLVVTARYHDDHDKQIDQVEFAQEILPLAGEISNYAAINRAIEALATRIRVYTVENYLAR